MSIGKSIGIFDSGLGGLSVVKHALDKMPHESVVYVGDQIHIPYGERTPDEIRSFALGITEFFIEKNAKLVIMACNMSSATALHSVQSRFPNVPIIGVIEAGVRAAIRKGVDHPIGVLATTGTVNSKAYTETFKRLLPEICVVEQTCPRFVSLVEAGMRECPEADEAAACYVEPLLKKGCRSLILGCTHYPFLVDAIRRVSGDNIEIIDPAEETAIEASNILFDSDMLNPSHVKPTHIYYTTAQTDQLSERGGQLLGRTIGKAKKITWGLELREIKCQEKMDGQTINSVG